MEVGLNSPFNYKQKMSKHRLFLPDSYSPLNTSVDEWSTPRNNKIYPIRSTNIITSKQGERNINSPEDVTATKEMAEKSLYNAVPFSSQDIESDPVDIEYFSRIHQKLPYSMQEDELILEFVLRGQNIFKVGSISLWKYLEAKKNNPRRTYQSLKNRFLRNIKPYLFTTYKHLVKDQETIDRILAKFPELKKRMGIRETLSNIILPMRQSQKTQARPYMKEEKQIKSVSEPKPDDVQLSVVQRQPVSSPSNPLNGINFSRKVTFSKSSIVVLVNLTDHNWSEASFSPLPKINERFKHLKSKRELFLCSACGKYSRPLRMGNSSESSTESDVVIPDSIDMNKELQNIDRIKLKSAQKNNSKTETNHRISPVENPSSKKGSQSLLNFDKEKNEIDVRAKDADDDESEGSQYSYIITRKKPVKIEKSVKMSQIKKRSGTDISEQETGLEAREKNGDSDSEIDIIYENAMAGFRKLINSDEEKMLSKKCLYKNRDMIGFNSDSEKNLDSYFLESSPEVDTPTFTKNFSTLLQNDSSETDLKSASSSHLASNMMKMLANEK